MNLPDQQGARWRSIMEIFDRAAEMPPGERQAFLESDDYDRDVRQQVIELLQKLEAHTGSRVPPRPAVPDRIGRYLVLEPLGRGGMGEVFLAQDTELDRRVALKFLSADTFGGRTGVDVLTREAKALSALNHPNIVTIHEVIQSGTAFAIVMELVEGTALRSKVGTPVKPGQLAQIGHQIALALAAAHSAGIIHRDIKPENIILRTDGYVKVLDFGLARRMNPEAQTSTTGLAAVGTVRYMSPEQVRGSKLTGSSDVFSLGLVLYELATGGHPFASASLFETGHAITAHTPPPPSSLNSEISPALDSLILIMLAKDPGARPSAADVALSLGDAVTGTTAAFNPSRRQVSRRWIVGSTAATVLSGAAGAYWWRNRFGANSPMRVLLDKGEVRDPVFSPDGSRIAFSWKPPGSERFHLALIPTGGGKPSVLATGGAIGVGPAWSPDGQRICFARQGFGENALYVKALGDGAERRVTTLSASTLGDLLDWVPGTTTVVVAHTSSGVPLTLLDLETGARRHLPTEPASSDTSPKCSPDGEWIAFSRYFTQTTSDLFVIATSGGAARRLTFDTAAKRGHRWTPDGRGILFKARFRNRWGLWHVPAAGGTVREVALPHFAVGAFDLRAEPEGGLVMASVDQYQIAFISRMEIPAEGQGPSSPVRMIAAGERGENLEANPSISPDGLRIAFVSLRSGSPEIWVSDNAGDTTKQITSFGGPEITQPAWSPDGRYLVSASAPDGRRNLFLLNVESGDMRWLTTSGLEETEPQWSRDGRWITFASKRSGRQELWRMPAAGGPARRLTQDGGAVHRESPDGRWLYFVHHEQSGLWRMPWQGGKAELVLDRVYSELYRAWAIGRRGVYYTYKDAGSARWTVALYDPDKRTERPLSVFSYPLPRWSGALTVSPDERWMLLPMIEAFGSRLVLFSGVKV